ncbi:MFS transporter [Burkholderia plantarii]|uniref:Major facilitator superfamily MFS-1 transporter n=1 Tax=Burkholderia plantarii TaxID=41899 RepID=A0A0B6S144_BURPL|nr:MFS transporter [Burkholderia plantarii]AJK45946.1 major facilitator superfamily MFS-1 transporter [Burkholderia plantarii]ALK30200.1 hexuronate transporter [Burkholderia plantarii]GLZ18303.1 hexuronate transporter [Burkholderia plantarii]
MNPPNPGGPGALSSRYRWTICAMMFFATTINYMDRQTLGLLAPLMQADIGWSQVQYAQTVMIFTAAYALGLLLFGRVADRLSTKLVYGGAMALWSAAAMLHALAASVPGFAAVRGLLGFAEASNFPVALRTTAVWFPKRERALATGIWNMGATVGGVVAPAIIPAMAVLWGWRPAFAASGAVGFVWFAAWLVMYRKPARHPRVAPDELAYINADEGAVPDERKVGWLSVLRHREAWAFMVGKLLTDPVWWFYLFWLPKWLNEANGIDMQHMGPPLVTIYAMACGGSVLGGWASSRLIARSGRVNYARKLTMAVCALCVTPIALLSQFHTLWFAVLAVGLAAAAHQGWSANLVTLVSDVFPRRAVGTVIGIGGTMGMLGSFLFSGVIGETLQRTGQYWALFAIGALAYLVALAIMHALMPRMTPVMLREAGEAGGLRAPG